MAAFLTDFILELQARRALLESSRDDGYIGRVSVANHRLPCRTVFFVKPQLLHSSHLDTSEYIEPRSFLAQVLSNLRSPELKLHNGMRFDNEAFQDSPACL